MKILNLNLVQTHANRQFWGFSFPFCLLASRLRGKRKKKGQQNTSYVAQEHRQRKVSGRQTSVNQSTKNLQDCGASEETLRLTLSGKLISQGLVCGSRVLQQNSQHMSQQRSLPRVKLKMNQKFGLETVLDKVHLPGP